MYIYGVYYLYIYIHIGVPSVGIEDEEVYYIGIIDILQLYNTRKVAENFFKGFTYDRHEISAGSLTYYFIAE